jgi:hypothetical protein
MKRLLLVALMVLVTLVGMVGFSRAGNGVSALQASANATNDAVGTLQATVNAGVPAEAKMYYLTVTSFTGGGAIGACDSGFHMASISEIQDPSNLQYVTSTPVYDSIVDDQGLGPPSNRMGWVRTGPYPMTVSPHTCDVSMTSSGQQSGTTMSRRSQWDGTSWWYTTLVSCSQPESVWCVEDPN